jgi:hypothetical protein
MTKNSVVEGKTVKLSMDNYNWLTSQEHKYGESIDQIFSHIKEELEAYRRQQKKH